MNTVKKLLFEKKSGNDENSLEQNSLEQIIITLDPLTTIIRISSLQFRPQETKLTFSPYSVIFDLPTNPPILQGIKRFFSGRSGHRSSKNDISLLKNTILQFIKLYDLSDPVIQFFAKGGIKGLEQLNKCYKIRNPSDLSVHCVEYYIKIIQEEINRVVVSNQNSLDEEKEKIENEEKREEKDEEEKMEEELEDEKIEEKIKEKGEGEEKLERKDEASAAQEQLFKSLWTESKKNLIHNLLTEIENEKDKKSIVVEKMVEALDIILLANDRILEVNYQE